MSTFSGRDCFKDLLAEQVTKEITCSAEKCIEINYETLRIEETIPLKMEAPREAKRMRHLLELNIISVLEVVNDDLETICKRKKEELQDLKGRVLLLEQYVAAKVELSTSQQSVINLLKQKHDKAEYDRQETSEVEESKALAAAVNSYHKCMNNEDIVYDSMNSRADRS
jgi:hypothetical protein